MRSKHIQAVARHENHQHVGSIHEVKPVCTSRPLRHNSFLFQRVGVMSCEPFRTAQSARAGYHLCFHEIRLRTGVVRPALHAANNLAIVIFTTDTCACTCTTVTCSSRQDGMTCFVQQCVVQQSSEQASSKGSATSLGPRHNYFIEPDE